MNSNHHGELAVYNPVRVPERPLDRVKRILAGLFLPQIRIAAPPSYFEGYPEQARLERPMQTRAQTRWIQSDIETAILMADSGDLSMAARLARAMRRDGTFSGIMSTRAGGLTRLPKRFRGTDEVVSRLREVDDTSLFDRIFPPKELELLDADGILLGVGVGELLPIPGRSEPIFVRLEPEFLRYRWSEDRWYYSSIAGQIPVTPGDGRWILHCPGGYQSPWTNGLWPSLGRAYICKEHAFLYRENYSGKLANPARVAVSPQGAADDQKRSFFQRVMAWGVNSVFSLPPGWDVKLIESNGTGYDVFMQTIDASDKEFMVGIAGQIVTVTGGAGFANADIHATIRSDLIQGDGDGLASTINTQGLRPVLNYMFGGGHRGVVEWDTRPPADLKAQAESISAASQAIEDANRALAPYGMRVDASEMITRFNIPSVSTQSPSAQQALDAPVADTPPTDESAAELAQAMTEHGVDRCEHGRSNRCPMCGVERVRQLQPGVGGAPHSWGISWRPIPKAALSLVRDVA